jgi:chaperone BCS1
MASTSDLPNPSGLNPQTALLDAFFPGFSLISSALYKYSKIDLTIYIPVMLVIGLLVFASQYINTYFWEFADQHFMSTADIRVDDEMYNRLMVG